MKKMLIVTVGGGLTLFLLGGLIYEVLLGGFYEASLESATGVMRGTPVWWALVASELVLGKVAT